MKQALRVDKESRLRKMKEMEEDIRCHKQGNFFRRIRKLPYSRVIPTNTVLDEKDQTNSTDSRDTLQRCSMFRTKQLREYIVSELEDHSDMESDEVTKEEVENQCGRYAMATQQGTG